MGEQQLARRRLLEKVSAAFEPYVPLTKEREKVRACLKSYMRQKVADLQTADNDAEIDVKGVRAEYLQAVRANVTAKRRYEETISMCRRDEEASATTTTTTTTSDNGDVSASALLERHAELLRLQKQNVSLVELTDELEKVNVSRTVSRTVDTKDSSGSSESTFRHEAETDDTFKLEVVGQSVKTLELAVVQAHHEALRQRSMLEKAKSQGRPSPDSATGKQRLHALSTTRQRLTQWIEESLEKCQDHDDGSGSSVPEPGQTDGLHADVEDNYYGKETIDRQYEQYLAARRRVLAAVSALGAPLSQKQSKLQSQNKGEQSVLKPPRTETDVGPYNNDILNLIEKDLTPNVQLQATTQAHLAFTTEQIESEVSATINMLDRLGDESQLLLAFPLLAHSGRFEHAVSAFGSKPPTKKEKSNPVSDRLEPWVFAAEAADVASAGVLGSHLKRGQQAMDSVARNLVELRLLREAQADEENFMP